MVWNSKNSKLLRCLSVLYILSVTNLNSSSTFWLVAFVKLLFPNSRTVKISISSYTWTCRNTSTCCSCQCEYSQFHLSVSSSEDRKQFVLKEPKVDCREEEDSPKYSGLNSFLKKWQVLYAIRNGKLINQSINQLLVVVVAEFVYWLLYWLLQELWSVFKVLSTS